MGAPVIFGLGRDSQPDDMTKQAFTAVGRRRISRHDFEDEGEGAVFKARRNLENTLNVWLSISMPVHRWRTAPEVDRQLDFTADETVVQIYARGWLDIDVRLGDHRPWLVEL
jgi:hypothetical protein